MSPRLFWPLFAVLLASPGSSAPTAEPAPAPALVNVHADEKEWANPLILQRADPHAYRHTDGWYYFTATVPEYDRIELRRARTLAELGQAEAVVVWRKHSTGVMGAHIWAPEIHFIEGKWYIYFSAGEAEHPWAIRPFVLECESENPLTGPWKELGSIKTQWESFSLDATTFSHRGVRYLVWAQRDPAIKSSSNLYISRMAGPTTLVGPQVRLTQPELPWEKVRHAVNEAPAVLVRNGRVLIAYSAAGTGAEYCLGLLSCPENGDLLDAAQWNKASQPVMTSNPALQIFGPGHNAFVQDEQGRDILLYHARNYAEIQGDPLGDPNRNTRARLLQWNADGTPRFQ